MSTVTSPSEPSFDEPDYPVKYNDDDQHSEVSESSG